jgi:hypothetical protein
MQLELTCWVFSSIENGKSKWCTTVALTVALFYEVIEEKKIIENIFWCLIKAVVSPSMFRKFSYLPLFAHPLNLFSSISWVSYLHFNSYVILLLMWNSNQSTIYRCHNKMFSLETEIHKFSRQWFFHRNRNFPACTQRHSWPILEL